MGNRPSYPAIRVLTHLTELAARDGGYRVAGARGWATTAEIEQALATWGTPELMRAQTERGRVLRADVRAPGETKPVWAYRISTRGIEVLATVGMSLAVISDPAGQADQGVYLREGVAAAVDALRRAAADPRVREREWVQGECGWRSARELTRLLEMEDEEAGRSPGRGFFSEDLRWLVKMEFADEHVIGKTHVYRLSATGAALKPLHWKE